MYWEIAVSRDSDKAKKEKQSDQTVELKPRY